MAGESGVASTTVSAGMQTSEEANAEGCCPLRIQPSMAHRGRHGRRSSWPQPGQPRTGSCARLLVVRGQQALTISHRSIGESAAPMARTSEVSMQVWGQKDPAAMIVWAVAALGDPRTGLVIHCIGAQFLPLESERGEPGRCWLTRRGLCGPLKTTRAFSHLFRPM